jgi:hypothetical protein
VFWNNSFLFRNQDPDGLMKRLGYKDACSVSTSEIENVVRLLSEGYLSDIIAFEFKFFSVREQSLDECEVIDSIA